MRKISILFCASAFMVFTMAACSNSAKKDADEDNNIDTTTITTDSEGNTEITTDETPAKEDGTSTNVEVTDKGVNIEHKEGSNTKIDVKVKDGEKKIDVTKKGGDN